MRVIVALENRFVKTTNGDIYSTTVCNYDFWSRYLQVFDEVMVFARVAEIEQARLPKQPASGSNVDFISLPSFIGPCQYLKKYYTLNSTAKKAVSKADAYILRIPGTVTSLLWHYLRKEHIPYGVEVVGNPWDSAQTLGANILLKPLLKWIFPRNQRQQCRHAAAAAYVSRHYLQKYYPPECWSTHYSSIDLYDEAIVNRLEIDRRFETISKKIQTGALLNICHVGSMSAMYKAQDILIEAVAVCRKKGFNVQLTLLGDGVYQDAFMRKAQESGIAKFVEFIGRIPPGQPIREYLDNADIFVLPSLTEGLPRSLIEAMARALPCIGTAVGGIKELLLERDLVNPGNVEHLADKLMSVITNPDRMREMSLYNLEKAKEFRFDELNKRRIKFYKKVSEATREYCSEQEIN